MIALLLSVLILVSAVPTQLQYNVGDDYQFQFSSFLNHSAKSAVQGTQGSLSSMTGIMEIECQDWDGKLFYFVMNLFNVDVEAANGLGRRKSLNVGDDGLGLDMFFSMTPQGQIPDIWYQDGDDMFFVNVKASAINALQTHIVPLSVKPVYQEADQIGTHNTQFSSVLQATALNVFKTFTQNDVIQFADKAVSKATFQLMGQSVVQIDATGFIRSSSTSQQVTFRSVLSGQSQKRASEIGFDGNLYSHGAFQLSVISQNQQNKRVTASFQTAPKVKSSLMEIGSMAADAKNIAKVSNAQQLIFLLEDNPTKTNYHELRTIANLFEAKPAFLKEVAPVLIQEVQKPNKGVLLNRFLFALGLVDSTQTNSVLREMLSVETLQREVARSLTTSRVTDCSLIPVVQSLTKSKQGREDYLLAFGSLTRRCATHDARQKASTYLNQLQSQAQKTNDAPLAAAVQGAMQNAGLAAPVAIRGSDYPFNKSFDKNLTVGGSVLNANFELDLFIGTNFDCNQKYFNYLASAEASATIEFLGTAKNAFEARGIYGKDNGVSAGDQIYVRVWDDVVYNQQIPQIDCSVHQYPIGTWQSPGFDVTYTIWISVIPVTFTAGVDVQLALDWAWQVCDSTLSVQVELIPDGKLVAFASAQSDLIIIEGGIELDADFELTPKPQAFIHGSECEVGFDVEASYDPMEAELDVWWRENVCEWWIFDCHWGPYHTDSLWSWNAARNIIIAAL